jgi:hypothetical protein
VEAEEGEGMRAQGGGGGRAWGREERKEVTWAWMGRKGFGKRGLGLVSRLEVPAVVLGFLSHGNSNRKGMAAMVAAGRAGEGRACQGLHAHGTGKKKKKKSAKRFPSWALSERMCSAHFLKCWWHLERRGL